MAAVRMTMAVDANNPTVGDLYLDGGTSRLTKSLSEEVQQTLWERFRMFKGEWFLNANRGVPWFQEILGIKNSIGNVGAILRSVITTCPGVGTLDAFDLKPVGRAISPEFRCRLTSGVTLKSSDFPPFEIPIP